MKKTDTAPRKGTSAAPEAKDDADNYSGSNLGFSAGSLGGADPLEGAGPVPIYDASNDATNNAICDAISFDPVYSLAMMIEKTTRVLDTSLNEGDMKTAIKALEIEAKLRDKLAALPLYEGCPLCGACEANGQGQSAASGTGRADALANTLTDTQNGDNGLAPHPNDEHALPYGAAAACVAEDIGHNESEIMHGGYSPNVTIDCAAMSYDEVMRLIDAAF